MVSHHDLMRCLERTLRRAKIPMAHSQGFNPRPKVVFPLALALGIAGEREVVELELADAMDPDELLWRLQAASPPGFDFLEAELTTSSRSPQADAVRYELRLPEDRRVVAKSTLAAFLGSSTWPYVRHREGRSIKLDLRPFVLEARLDAAGVLQLRMKMAPNGSARPEEIIDALGLRDLLEQGAILTRKDVELTV
jgi:radical SAM-linked protein